MALTDAGQAGTHSTVATPPSTVLVYAGYFALQAVAGVAFWVVVATVPVVRRAFEMWPKQHAVTDSFLFADVAIGIAGSAVAAWGLRAGAGWARALALFVAGGMVYATVYLAGWVAFTGVGSGLLALMVVPSTLSAWCAVQAWRLPPAAPPDPA
jgi:hypothetical protein